MLNTADFEQFHQNMIAGQIPNHRGDVRQSIFFIARDILNTSHLHLLVSLSLDDSVAYYLAAPSSAFSSIAEFSTAMALAFPRHPGHRGNGAYLSVNGACAVALIKSDATFRLMSNSTAVLQDFIANHELEVHDVSNSAGWPLESTARTYTRYADTFSRRAIKLSAISIALCLMLSLGAALVQAQLKASSEQYDDLKTIQSNGLINKVEFSSLLNMQLGRLQKLGANVVRAGGWIEEYTLKDGNEKFRIAMPEWVTKDYVEAMGGGVIADHDRAASVIMFVKEQVTRKNDVRPAPALPPTTQSPTHPQPVSASKGVTP
jgi:hypothetical protein